MKISIALPLLSFLLFMNSCIQKDVLLDVDMPEPQLVLNSYITPDSAVCLKIGRTHFITETPAYDLSDAAADIYINGEYAGAFTEESYQSGSTRLFKSDVRVGYGDQVMVRARAEGFTPVSAQTYIPVHKPVIDIDTVRLGKNKMEYKVHLKGKPGLGYYRIFLFHYYDIYIDGNYDTSSQRHQLMVDYSKEPVLLEEWGYAEEEYKYYDYHLFTNRSFIGKDYTLTLQSDYVSGKKFVGYHPESGKPVQVEYRAYIVAKVLELSEDCYRHLKTLTDYKIDEGWDWIRVYSNVENGTGILGGFTESYVVAPMPMAK